MARNSSGSKTIGAVKTSFRILEVLETNSGASLAELADALNISKPTIHHHLATLREEGYVVQVDGDYHLGLRFLPFGRSAMHRHEFLGASLGEVESLQNQTDRPVHLAVAESGAIFFIHSSIPESASRTDIELGKSVDPMKSAPGKAILSHLSIDDLKTFLSEADIEADPDAVAESMADVRDRKVAFDDRKGMGDIVCAPVLDGDGEQLGAICVSAENPRDDDTLIDAVRTAAGVISIDTAYQSWIDVPNEQDTSTPNPDESR